eukprot:7926459-Karenia_brevis.AAC.1
MLLNAYGFGILTFSVCFGSLSVLSQSGHLKCLAAFMYSSGHLAALKTSINGSFNGCPNLLCKRLIAALAAR